MSTQGAIQRKEALIQLRQFKQAIQLYIKPVEDSSLMYYSNLMAFNKCLGNAQGLQGLNVWKLSSLSKKMFDGAVAYIEATQRFVQECARGFLSNPKALTRFNDHVDNAKSVPGELLEHWQSLANALGCSTTHLEFAQSFNNDEDRNHYFMVKNINPMLGTSLVEGRRRIEALSQYGTDLDSAYKCRMYQK